MLATSSSAEEIRYAIYSGDPQRLFQIDERTGMLSVARDLDADALPAGHQSLMLNVQAAAGNLYNHTQVATDIQ